MTQDEPSSDLDRARSLARAERERNARKEAERILEDRSRALFEANERLNAVVAALEKEADRRRALLEHMPVKVVITDAAGNVVWLNQLAQSKFSADLAISQKNKIDSLLPELNQELMTSGTHARDPLHPWQTVAVGGSGESFPCEVVAADIDLNENPQIIWMVRDISQRITAERKRQQLENELRQAQRLESLGTMAGGIAHELNTPIQFIADNTSFLKTAFANLSGALVALKHEASQDVLQTVEEKFDLTYLLNEIPASLTQNEEGLSRVAEIVLAIKRFSHPARAGKELADINQILRTTATVAKNQWKYVADLQFKLQQDIPLIKCNVGELNQAFLNLIVNAAHAIEDAQTKASGQITIETRLSGANVECLVSDTGIGIAPENLARIFDLFFTTKAPGRGTGQGLAMVHSIVVQSHHGAIDVTSEPGKGTTFKVTLPLDSGIIEPA